MSSFIKEEEPIAQDSDNHCVNINPTPTTSNSIHNNPLPSPVTATSVTSQVSETRRVLTRDISYTDSLDNLIQQVFVCHCLFIIFMLLLLLIVIVVLVFTTFKAINKDAYLDENKYNPKFEVESLIVSAFNISDSRLIANWDVKISTINQNSHKSFMYKSFEVAIYHHKAYLSEEGVGATLFHQPPKNQTLLNARLRAYELKISDSIAVSMSQERDLGEIDFHVYIYTRVRYELPSYNIHAYTHLITAACKYVKGRFAPNATKGTMIGHANICPIISNKRYLDNQAGTDRAEWKGVEDNIYTIDWSKSQST